MILRELKNFHNLVGAVCAACLISAMTGIVTSWSSPVIPKLQNLTNDNPFQYPVSSTEASWMTSLLTLGGCIGVWLFGFLAQTLGRRFAMCVLGAPVALSYLLMAIFPTIEIYFVGRFVMGLCLGGAQVTTMAYNSEITSKYNRGVIMTFTGMMVSVGSLFSYCTGPWVSVTTFNIIQAVIPLSAVALALIFCVETPYFYLLKNKQELAEQSLRAYRGQNVVLEKEIMEIRQNIKEQQMGNLIDVIRTKSFLKSFIIATMLLVFQQFTGINGIIMYSQSIFDMTGSNLSSSSCTIILGVIQVISGGIAPLVANRFNRKTLLIVSCLGMIVADSILGIYCVLKDYSIDMNTYKFIPITTLCFFIFSYNFGVGPLCWMVGSEVYSTRVKTLAFSFSIFVYQVIGFLIAQYFNTVVQNIGIGQLFIIFAGCCILCIIFVQFYVLETKSKSLEEIQNILQQ